MNLLIAQPSRKKLAALETAAFFEECAVRADYAGFDRITVREGGEPPRAGDERGG